eukprot:scaffold166225_cov35-Tisochrysis_lutea.AAC.4
MANKISRWPDPASRTYACPALHFTTRAKSTEEEATSTRGIRRNHAGTIAYTYTAFDHGDDCELAKAANRRIFVFQVKEAQQLNSCACVALIDKMSQGAAQHCRHCDGDRQADTRASHT